MGVVVTISVSGSADTQNLSIGLDGLSGIGTTLNYVMKAHDIIIYTLHTEPHTSNTFCGCGSNDIGIWFSRYTNDIGIGLDGLSGICTTLNYVMKAHDVIIYTLHTDPHTSNTLVMVH